MSSVFLSHSSADKKRYVKIVADNLQKKFNNYTINYDEYTFEAGMKSIEEIERGLEKSDLFVLFISNKALESNWVKTELNKAEKLFKNGKINRIYPIIIDSNIKHTDKRIPEFLKIYNLKYVSKPTKCVTLIQKRLVEITWDIHPRLKEKEEIFVGRNDIIKNFESRLYDYTLPFPSIFIASGIDKIGRTTLLKECFTKCSIMDKSYIPSIIHLSSYDSIEDFILNLYSLGFSNEINMENYLTISQEEKIDIAINLINDLLYHDEIVLIKDYGCIVNHEGLISDWFIIILNRLNQCKKVIFGIASKFKIYMPTYIYQNLYYIDVPQLNKMERSGLLQRYLNFENIELGNEDTRTYLNLQDGFPEQIFFTVDLIAKYGPMGALDFTNDIVEYSIGKVTNILNYYEESKEDLEFIRFLAEFDVISYDMLIDITNDIQFVNNKIKDYYTKGIIEYSGLNKEYVLLNSAVKQYILRAEFKISDFYNKQLYNHINKFVKTYNFQEIEIPDMLYSVKESMIRGLKIDTKYLIPSNYLKTMVELYEKRKDYKKVIFYADKALENEDYIDKKIIFELRYFLCLSLAKTKNRRMLKEVQNINGADHNFLLAFYYRMIGKFTKALEELNKSLNLRPNFSKAKRELVQVLLNLEEYEKARKIAKENYENDKSNPYHIHAYFSCVIKAEKSVENANTLKNILNSFSKIKTSQGIEMYKRATSIYYAFYKENKEKSLSIINNLIHDSDFKLYALLDKFEICEKFKYIEGMEEVIDHLQQSKDQYDINRSDVTLTRLNAILYAYKGDINTSIDLIINSLSNENINTEKLLNKIEKIESYVVDNNLNFVS